MRKVIAFEQVSLDGYFVDGKGDMSWAHKQDAEWNAFAGQKRRRRRRAPLRASDLRDDGELLADAAGHGENARRGRGHESDAQDRVLANARAGVVGEHDARQGRPRGARPEAQGEPGPGLAILGSGSIVSLLAQAGLIDEFQIVVNPIVLGKGRTLFEGVQEKIALKLTQSRAFGNGNVVLYYQPIA